MQLKTKKGLDIPIKGGPEGEVQTLPPAREIALDVDTFDEIKFKVLVQVGEAVKLGQPLLLDKGHPERVFVSPAGGVVKEIRRGLKRRLLSIVIERASAEQAFDHGETNVDTVSREQLVEKMCQTGIFAHVRMRPFNLLANPKQRPYSIFVQAIESAPFVPPPEMQVQGHEEDFTLGLRALAKLTPGKVHLVYREGSDFKPFVEAQEVETHSARGPHPIGNPSFHIQQIHPIESVEDLRWTLKARDVVVLGCMLRTGRYHVDKVVAIGGEGVLPDRRGYFRARQGYPIEALLADRGQKGHPRLISGNLLTGKKVEVEDFLGFHHTTFVALPELKKRQFLHFFRLGFGKYSWHKAYISGHIKGKEYSFTTNQHGEERAFIDGEIYDKVMPLSVTTMPLVKSVLARDWDQAEALGLLEVSHEDFALPAFICPSKIEMTSIIKLGLSAFAEEVLA